MKYLGVISRVLIALLFVVAGILKLMDFSGTVGYLSSLGVPQAEIMTVVVILIEIVVAGLFAIGYKKCATGGIIILFIIVATLLTNRDWSNAVNMIQSLKNIAIIGGVLAVISNCDCGKCPMSTKSA